jgi:hypothetical protein
MALPFRERRPRTLAEDPDGLREQAPEAWRHGLLGLLQAAHGMVTGIEKNLPTPTSRYLEQHATHMWLASAFGQPRRNLLADPPELLTTAGWRRLLDEVRCMLQELENLGTQGTAHVGVWHDWRDCAVGLKSWLGLPCPPPSPRRGSPTTRSPSGTSHTPRLSSDLTIVGDQVTRIPNKIPGSRLAGGYRTHAAMAKNRFPIGRVSASRDRAKPAGTAARPSAPSAPPSSSRAARC